jgi:hypothetical protein
MGSLVMEIMPGNLTQISSSDDGQTNEKSKGLKAIPGTMQIHSVVPVSDSQIAVRKVSCYFMQRRRIECLLFLA